MSFKITLCYVWIYWHNIPPAISVLNKQQKFLNTHILGECSNSCKDRKRCQIYYLICTVDFANLIIVISHVMLFWGNTHWVVTQCNLVYLVTQYLSPLQEGINIIVATKLLLAWKQKNLDNTIPLFWAICCPEFHHSYPCPSHWWLSRNTNFWNMFSSKQKLIN